MTHEILEDILYTIRHNNVRLINISANHDIYQLFGENRKLLLQAEVFDYDTPRITITINNKYFAHINNFARTEEQFTNNDYIGKIVSYLSTRNAEQYGVKPIKMTKKEIAISKFLHENSIKKY